MAPVTSVPSAAVPIRMAKSIRMLSHCCATAHYGILGPCTATGSLKRCIDLFLALPIVKLDRLVLISHLKEIGRVEGATAMAKAG